MLGKEDLSGQLFLCSSGQAWLPWQGDQIITDAKSCESLVSLLCGSSEECLLRGWHVVSSKLSDGIPELVQLLSELRVRGRIVLVVGDGFREAEHPIQGVHF